MRVLITGGGTGGHVSPAVAVIEELRRRDPSIRLLFLGSPSGVERSAVAQIRVPFKGVQVGKLRRYLAWQTPLDLLKIPFGVLQSLWCIQRFRPNALFSTGGYVSIPPVVAGWLLRVPILIHEQTASVGLANQIAARFADKVGISFLESARYFPSCEVIHTGNPVRPVIFGGDRVAAAKRFAFDADLPTLYVTGGVQGSLVINTALGNCLPQLLRHCQIIHQCGERAAGEGGEQAWLREQLQQLPAALQRRYKAFPFVREEIKDIYALADLILGRAGAGTVAEIAALGKPAVFVPLPQAAADEQRKNAEQLVRLGAAEIIPESELTPENLASAIQRLLADRANLERMGQASRALANPAAASTLANELLTLARR